MSIFDRFRRTKNSTLKESEFNEKFGGSRAASAVSVTPENALKISAVYAAVRILSESIGSLPLKVYQKTEDGRQVADHGLNELLGVSPNGEQSAMEFREFQVASLTMRGNAFAQVQRDGLGRVRKINPLKPGYGRLDRDGAGRLVLDYQEPGNTGTYSPGELWRVAGLGSDGVTGLSPITLARESMGLSIVTEQSAARMFANGNTTANTLEFPSTLNEDQIKRLRDQFVEHYAGWENAHKPLVLESGMTAKTIGLSATDAQFLESRKFQISEIARWYRVPLHMLSELGNATFSNIEHQSIEFVMHTLRPWMVRIEQTISRDLLTAQERKNGLYMAHTVEGLLRGDTKSRYEAYSKGIVDGWLNRNEVRELENRNPVEGLDAYLVPLNMGTAHEAVEDLAGAENRILAKEAAVMSSADFAAWLPGFYGRQEKRIADTLNTSAAGYGGVRMSRLARSTYTDPVDAVAESQKHTANDIEAFLK